MMRETSQWATLYLADVRREFMNQRGLAERAIEQLDDAQLLRAPAEESNSVAVLMKHVGGNLRSRWTEPFTTDGEKPDRNRDGEFEVGTATEDAAAVADVRSTWQRGWAVLDAALTDMTPADLEREVRIRGEAMSLITALNRSLAHTSQHAGQIIMLAKIWRDTEWQTLSIPRNRNRKG